VIQSGRSRLRRLKSKPWVRLIRQCQDIVASLDPHPYYPKAYREAEMGYWSKVAQWLWQDIRAGSPKRCLDVGCAYGTLALFCKVFTDAEVYCIDVTDAYLSTRLAEEFGLHFAICNIEIDPVPFETGFDVIIFTEVLEHLNCHPLPTLLKLRGLLIDDGLIYLSTPDARQWGRSAYYDSYEHMPQPLGDGSVDFQDDHIYLFDEEEIRTLMARAGLEILRFDYAPGAGARHFNLTLTRASH